MELCTQHYGVYSDNLDKSLKFYNDILGFTLLFRAEADEGGTPLHMAWIRNDFGVVIELLQKDSYNAKLAADQCSNHIALRTADMERTVAELKAKGVVMEVEPFESALEFGKGLEPHFSDTFATSGNRDVKLKVAFFRGPFGERFELMQDNLSDA